MLVWRRHFLIAGITLRSFGVPQYRLPASQEPTSNIQHQQTRNYLPKVILCNYGKIRNNNLVSCLLDLYNLQCFDSLLSIVSILSLYFTVLSDHHSIYFMQIILFFPGVFSQANVCFPNHLVKLIFL